MRNPLLFSTLQSAVLVALVASGVCPAQSTSQKSNITVTHVKPEMLDEWRDLQRNEVIPALKKAGVKSRTVYRTWSGPGYEFITIEPFEKYADWDGPSPLSKGMEAVPLARLNAKLRKCIASQQHYVVTSIPDLNNPTDKPTEVQVLTTYRIAAGKMEDFQKLMKNEVVPLYKKANVRFNVSQRGFGANPNEVGVSVGFAKMADLDLGPVERRQLGAEGAAALQAKFVGIRTAVERVVRRRVADLSF